MTGSLAQNYAGIQQRILNACSRAGRNPADIRLIWVSKNHPQEKILDALALGAHIFGENRVQEVLAKFPLPSSASPHELHLIGHLQKNKIRKVLPLATTLHSIDSLELLEAVQRVAQELQITRDVFLQVNTSREAAKSGFTPEALPTLLRSLPPIPNLRLIGLMTMGPEPDAAASGQAQDSVGKGDPHSARRCFRELSALLQSIQNEFALGQPSGPLSSLAFLSMGMTDDFEIAIEEGAHYLRIGTGLFGHRQ